MSFGKRGAQLWKHDPIQKPKRIQVYEGIQHVEMLKGRAGDLKSASRNFYLANQMGLLENVGIRHDEFCGVYSDFRKGDSEKFPSNFDEELARACRDEPGN